MDEYKLISLIKRKTGKQYKSISCDFIRLYKDKLDWNIICRKQILYE